MLAAAGLPRALAEAAHDEGNDVLVRASHDVAVALVGPHVGTPIVAVEGAAWFGPVLSRVGVPPRPPRNRTERGGQVSA